MRLKFGKFKYCENNVALNMVFCMKLANAIVRCDRNTRTHIRLTVGYFYSLNECV